MGSLDGHLTNLSTAPVGVERLWLLPSAANLVRYGFVRIVNESDETGEEYGPLTLEIGAGAAVQLSSSDLESGNADTGLTGSTGPGQERWRLAFESDLAFRVLGYVRNHGAPGFPNAVHDCGGGDALGGGLPLRGGVRQPREQHRCGERAAAGERSETEASVTITGTDDAGEAGAEAVTLTLPAGASRRLWAPCRRLRPAARSDEPDEESGRTPDQPLHRAPASRRGVRARCSRAPGGGADGGVGSTSTRSAASPPTTPWPSTA